MVSAQVLRRAQLGLKDAEGDGDEEVKKTKGRKGKGRGKGKKKGKGKGKIQEEEKEPEVEEEEEEQNVEEEDGKLPSKSRRKTPPKDDGEHQTQKKQRATKEHEGKPAAAKSSAKKRKAPETQKNLEERKKTRTEKTGGNGEEVPEESKGDTEGQGGQVGKGGSAPPEIQKKNRPTHTFARRVEPKGEISGLKWRELKDAFVKIVKPTLTFYSAHEVGKGIPHWSQFLLAQVLNGFEFTSHNQLFNPLRSFGFFELTLKRFSNHFQKVDPKDLFEKD